MILIMTRVAARAASLLRPYRTFFASPGVLPVALPAYLGRLTPSITSLALVLVVKRQTGSFAVAGAATAAYYLAVAVMAPVAGRLMDRVGARPVLLASGVLYPAALLGIVLGPRLGLGRTGTQALCAVAGFAQERAEPAAVGVLLALWSAGGIIGALWYGGRRWSIPARQQFPWALAALATSLVPIALARGLPDMALCMLLAGLVVAPVGVLAMQLIAVVAPPETRTEAFGWQNTASYAGFALGSSLGGLAIDSLRYRLAALVPSVAVLLALAVMGLWWHSLAAPAAATATQE